MPPTIRKKAVDEGGEQNAPAAARRKGAKGVVMGGTFGDVLQKALERKLPKGSKGPAVGSGAKDSVELKKRIKKDKEAREEKMILAEKRKWFQKEHVVPVRRPPAPRADCVQQWTYRLPLSLFGAQLVSAPGAAPGPVPGNFFGVSNFTSPGR